MDEDRLDSNGHASTSVPKAVGYVALWSDNPESLRDFFTAIFHYDIIYEDHSVIVFDMEGETDLIIQRVDQETAHLNGTTRFGIYADSLLQLTKVLKERGATLAEELVELGDDQFLTVIEAPTGHQIELVGSAALGLAADDEWDEES